MKKLLVFFIATVAGLTTVAAQSESGPEIKFKEMTHDFGTFPEETGKVSCTFEFTNTGKSDLILQKVTASCGCTTPDWTRTPVQPGEKGVVQATFNAAGRPGAFNKTITVTSNAGEQKLTIKGDVIKKEPKVEDQYPFDLNGLRIKNQNVYMYNVEYSSSKTERIEVVNSTQASINISFKGVPAYLTVKASPATLKANEKGTIDVTLDSKAAKEWGNINSEFTIAVNEKAADDKKIIVFANIVENFSSMTPEQRANAPVLNVVPTVNVGIVKANSKQAVKFSIENTGKSELLIHKASAEDKAVIATAPKSVKAGKKDEVKLQINSENMKPGKFSSRVTLYTNDPNKSVTYVQIEGEVK